MLSWLIVHHRTLDAGYTAVRRDSCSAFGVPPRVDRSTGRRAIPFRYRTYDASTKAWTVSPEFADLAMELLRERFLMRETPRRARGVGDPTMREMGSDHFRVLHLRETAPVELIEASYRVLASAQPS